MSDELVGLVLDCLGEVLALDAPPEPDAPLLGGLGLDSIALVELVTRCEQVSGTTLAPDLFVPGTFASARSLAAALAASRPVTRSGP
jgi:acyl carrier protein